jgi:sarcosine oxidase
MSQAERRHAEVIVIGLGAVGAATLYQLAKAGVPAVGIDRFRPPHDQGSSHGESRITRLAVGEGDDYAPLVRRSHAIWRDLEARSGERLLDSVGGLVIDSGQATPHHGRANFLDSTIAVARRHHIRHEVLTAAEIAYRFPVLQLSGAERGYFEPEAGMAFPERCIAVQLGLARELGAELRLAEPVISVASTESGVVVQTAQARIEAGYAVLAAGPWAPTLAPQAIASRLTVYRQTLHWFDAPDDLYAPRRFPIFLWMHGATQEDYFYGFPCLGRGQGIKVATERYDRATHADTAARHVSPDESAAIFSHHVHGRLRAVRGRPLKAAACLYTVTPDAGFLIDVSPEAPRLLVASACSGHGFKHSAALGEAIAARITGQGEARAAASLAPFGLHRFLHDAPRPVEA